MKTRITHTPFHKPVIVLYQCPIAVKQAAEQPNRFVAIILKLIGIQP
jgi:hypothetical protein